MEELYECFSLARDKWVPKYKRRRYYAKPWWSEECSSVWHERERRYRLYKQSRLVQDKIMWKIARAVAKKTFKLEKRESWKRYVATLNRQVSTAEVWQTIVKIREKPNPKIPKLYSNGKCISALTDIVNELATTFEQVSHEDNYSEEFKRNKSKREERKLDFTSPNNMEP